MRYPPEHKERTREKILEVAARRFRAKGGEASGIARLMMDLKLTHGGFYRHFENKDALFEAALQTSISEMGNEMERVAALAGPNAFDAMVAAYLSEGHCDHPERGCPLAALGSEIGRRSRRSRARCNELLLGYARRMARYMPGPEGEREGRAVQLFSAMAGSLTFARTIDDANARRLYLASAREFYLRAAAA